MDGEREGGRPHVPAAAPAAGRDQCPAHRPPPDPRPQPPPPQPRRLRCYFARSFPFFLSFFSFNFFFLSILILLFFFFFPLNPPPPSFHHPGLHIPPSPLPPLPPPGPFLPFRRAPGDAGDAERGHIRLCHPLSPPGSARGQPGDTPGPLCVPTPPQAPGKKRRLQAKFRAGIKLSPRLSFWGFWGGAWRVPCCHPKAQSHHPPAVPPPTALGTLGTRSHPRRWGQIPVPEALPTQIWGE